METAKKTDSKHIGRKICQIRELRGMKQDTLAFELGVSQQTISKIEQSAEVEDPTLDKIAGILGVSPQGIKNFSDESIISNINSFYDQSAFNFQCTFNPLDKLMEALEENKKLYERLLKSEQEKIEILKGSK
ncbi:helix-turn-helix domain-containing protein [Algoriphagus persicinus]|uniref:helix-turn-helix domain-containing protein n=1 Tax=Algoriphagus persicinus TaxID=3108754 RepID=UPI002B379D2B|nr:helix-turn-helix domain-containing protein [Algoriphagus sp. E1-3-M2]MEB2787306.1 helix-turn-helix domain-containing protein [Algoriphagus sp. E1-3-M2]